MRKLFLVLSCLSMVLAWLLPNHYYPWTSFYNEYLAFVALFFLVSACAVRGGCKGVGIGWAVFFLLGLSLVPLVQYFSGLILFFGDAFFAFLYLCAFSCSLLVGRGLYEEFNGRVFEFFSWVVLVGALFSAGLSFYQWFEVGGNIWVMDLAPGARPYANLAQPNNLATLLCLGLASLIYLFERKHVSIGIAGGLAFCLVASIALSQSRTSWLAALCFFVWWGSKGKYLDLRVRWSVLTVGCGVYALMIFLLPVLADFLGLSVSDLRSRAGSIQRLEIWWQALVAIGKGGLWGYGWNQVSMAQLAVTLDYPVSIQVEHAHNVVLDMLLWNGPVIGGGAVLLGFCWLGRIALNAKSVESVYALLVVGLVLLHGLLEFPLEYAYFLLPVGFLIGGLEAESADKPVCNMPSGGWFAFALIGLMVAICVWREYAVIEEDHRLMRFEARGIGELRAEQKAPDVMLMTQLREYIRFARTPAEAGMMAEEVDWMGNVSRRYPFPPLLFRYALALGLNERPQEAVQQLLVLRGLHSERDYIDGVQAIKDMAVIYPQLNAVLLLLGDKAE